MNRKLATVALAFGLALSTPLALAADATGLSKKKQTDLGLYLTAKEAYDAIQKEGDKLLFVDVRTRAEVNFLGMAKVADSNIPYMTLSEFYSWDDKKNNFQMELNDEFLPKMEQRLAAKGLSKDDKIILMCRSGSRSASAANLMKKAGYSNVYTVVDGFEGDKAKSGPLKGQRVVNGWKNSELPWSYKLQGGKMYISAE